MISFTIFLQMISFYKHVSYLIYSQHIVNIFNDIIVLALTLSLKIRNKKKKKIRKNKKKNKVYCLEI